MEQKKLQERHIEINASRKAIIEMFHAAYQKHLSTAPTQHSTVYISQPKILANNLGADIIRMLENAFGTALGGSHSILPEMSVELHSESLMLLEAYRQSWHYYFYEYDRDNFGLIKAKEIKSSSILLMELYYRLIIQALRTDTPTDVKLTVAEKRRVFISILYQLEGLVLQQEKTIFDNHHITQYLTTQHKAWVELVDSAVDRLDQMPAIRPTLQINSYSIKLLRQKIERRLLLYWVNICGLLPNMPTSGALSEEETQILLQAYETTFLAEQLPQAWPSIITTDIPITHWEGMVPTLTWINHKQVERTLIASHHTKRQNLYTHLAQHQRPEYKELLAIYALLNRTECIQLVLQQLSDFFYACGITVLLGDVVDLSAVDAMLREHRAASDDMLSQQLKAIHENNPLMLVVSAQERLERAEKPHDIPRLDKLRNEGLLHEAARSIAHNLTMIYDTGRLLTKVPLIKRLLAFSEPVSAGCTRLLPSSTSSAMMLYPAVPTTTAATTAATMITTIDVTNNNALVAVPEDANIRRKLVQPTPWTTPYIQIFCQNLSMEERTQLEQLGKTVFKYHHTYQSNTQAKDTSFLEQFVIAQFFNAATPFCRKLREVIIKFEERFPSMMPSSLEKLFPVWRQRHEELFFLKYLCVQSVYLKKDNDLFFFVLMFKEYSKRYTEQCIGILPVWGLSVYMLLVEEVEGLFAQVWQELIQGYMVTFFSRDAAERLELQMVQVSEARDKAIMAGEGLKKELVQVQREMAQTRSDQADQSDAAVAAARSQWESTAAKSQQHALDEQARQFELQRKREEAAWQKERTMLLAEKAAAEQRQAEAEQRQAAAEQRNTVLEQEKAAWQQEKTSLKQSKDVTEHEKAALVAQKTILEEQSSTLWAKYNQNQQSFKEQLGAYEKVNEHLSEEVERLTAKIEALRQEIEQIHAQKSTSGLQFHSQ